MKPIRLLIVDDDVDFAESQADLLETRGYVVSLASNGPEALELVRQESFDLVLQDMRMPGMNGIECLTAMRSIRPGIRVVMVTAFTHGEFVRQAFQSGALAVLGKLDQSENLLRTISFLAPSSTILLVEDNQDLAAEMSSIMEENGYSVLTVGSIKEAKSVLSRSAVDLLLLDFFLPDGHGGELLEWLKSLDRKQETVIITGHPESTVGALPYISIEDVIVKPFEPDKLLRVIARHDG